MLYRLHVMRLHVLCLAGILILIAANGYAQVEFIPGEPPPTQYELPPTPAGPALPSEQPPARLAPNQPTSRSSSSVTIYYTVKKRVEETFQTADGQINTISKYASERRSAEIDLEQDLQDLDLPPEGKRAAVLAVTAARHEGLLAKLKAAKTPEEREAARLALQENYTEHYAIETWWREQKLAELEARLTELREQVTQRQESEEKYVAAAMTIAELWADGIGISPPTPNSSQTIPVGGSVLLGPQTGAANVPYGVPPVSLPQLQPGYQPSKYDHSPRRVPQPAPNVLPAPDVTLPAPDVPRYSG